MARPVAEDPKVRLPGVRVRASSLAKIEALAADRGWSVSQVVAQALAEYLEPKPARSSADPNALTVVYAHRDRTVVAPQEPVVVMSKPSADVLLAMLSDPEMTYQMLVEADMLEWTEHEQYVAERGEIRRWEADQLGTQRNVRTEILMEGA